MIAVSNRTRRRHLLIAFAVVLSFGSFAPADSSTWTKPNDPAYRPYPADPHQNSLFLMEMEKAWAIEKGSPDVVIGVIDWAFDPGHPDLKNQLWKNAGEIPGNGKDDDGNGFVDDVHGWDFVDGDATLEGQNSVHGNHVCGIIAAQTNNGIGVAGMAPGCRLMLVKVGLPGVLRDGELMAKAIRYCVDNGARVICKNHGLSERYPGWHVPLSAELKEACDYAYKKGVLIISGTTSNDGVYYPLAFQPGYDSVMGTGASTVFGVPSAIYGGSLACEVIAPGGERTGGDSHGKEAVYSCYGTNPEYRYWAGGCMATPHVVGLMALVLSRYEGIDVEQARQIVRNTARGENPGFDRRWGHGLIQPVAALSLPAESIAALPSLAGDAPRAGTDSLGNAAILVPVRNAGALDGVVRVALTREGREIAHKEAVAVGLETTDVVFSAKGLPVVKDLKATLEPLGMARPRVYDDVLEIDLRVHSKDLTVRGGEGAHRSFVVPVENRGSVDAHRVGVIVYRNEPAPEVRIGERSHMVAARIISVPASGSAEAVFDVAELPSLENLWVEIEQLDVGAPHVSREHGKAKYTGADSAVDAVPVGPRTLAEFRFDAGRGNLLADSAGSDLKAEIDGAAWVTDGQTVCLAFDGRTSRVTVADDPSLAGMGALQIDARVKFDQPPRALEPLVYKWLSGNETASFGLGLLHGQPYLLVRTKEGGYVECRCTDLQVEPGRWHTVTFLYDGGCLTAAVDGKWSEVGQPAYGRIDSCKQPLRIGAATDKQGNLVSYAAAKIAAVTLRVPGVVKPEVTIPGELEVDRVVRVLVPDEPEVLYVSVPETGEVGLAVEFLEATQDAEIVVQWFGEEGQGGGAEIAAAALTRSAPGWKGRLDKGVYRLRLHSPERIAFRLDVRGPDDVWQTALRATDRGAGAAAKYTAWLSTKMPGKHVVEIFDCSEGARLLFLPERGTIQERLQTGGVMGDSSSRMGGRGLWREHAFQAGPKPCGAWFSYPSKINAAGDYAIRGDFTIHWRRPPEEIAQQFADSPTMRAMKYTIRGGETDGNNRGDRYREAIDSGLSFMEALTEEIDDGTRIFERWMSDRDGPRIYWGNDGQMLCARTYQHAFQLGGDERWGRYALGIGRRVIGRQLLDESKLRHGALPYGLIGSEEKVSWGSSNNIQGKILYGLAQLATSSKDKMLLEALKLNADYYVRMQYDNGRWAHYVERAPESMCGYPTAWGVSGLLIAYETLGDEKYLVAAERALGAYLQGIQENEGLKPDGSIVCWCTHAQAAEDNHAIRSSLTMLTPFALAYRITKKEQYAHVLDDLHRFLTAHQHESGVVKYADWDTVNLIYAQNWGPQGLCEAYEATGEQKFLDCGLKLADFFVRVQLVSDDPHYHGAWVGSFNVAKDYPGGDIDDEGNLYDLYTSWGAGPIVYGLQRLLPHVEEAE